MLLYVIAGAAFFYFLVWPFLWKKITNDLHGFSDIDNLGMPAESKGEHAVVIGGSWTGSLSAVMLLSHFKRVTILERDEIPDEAVPRTTVPQERHAHVMLAWGMDIVNALMKRSGYDITKEIVDGGGRFVDMRSEVITYYMDNFFPRWDCRTPVWVSSRTLMERSLQKGVKPMKAITRVYGAAVNKLLPADDGSSRVGAVEYTVKEKGERVKKRLACDFVVDAAGKTQQGMRWLEELGCGKTPVEDFNPNSSYSSVHFKVPKGFETLNKFDAMTVYPAPPVGRHYAYLFKWENDVWIATIIGVAGGQAPNTLEKFFQVAETEVRHDVFAQELARLKQYQTGDIYYLQAASSRRVKYGETRVVPDNFAAVGDAICRFNPIYGQGLTTSALSVLTLDGVLRSSKSLKGVGRKYGRKNFVRNEMPYQFGTISDKTYAANKSDEVKLQHKLMQWWLKRIIKAQPYDRVVFQNVQDAFGMRQSGLVFFSPSMVARVLYHWALRTIGLEGDDNHSTPPPKPFECVKERKGGKV